MSKASVYQEIRKRCRFVWSERSSDYEQRREYWKNGRIQYTVLIKVTPCRDKVVRICGCVIN